MAFNFDVKIDTVHKDGVSWWGRVYLFQHDQTEPPLHTGPHQSERAAEQAAQRLADIIVGHSAGSLP